MSPKFERMPWVAPEITELALEETHARPGRGADIGGNMFVDCQRS